MSSILLLKNIPSSNINIVETFANSLGNNIYDTNLQKFYYLQLYVDSSSNPYIEGTLTTTHLLTNISTLYTKKSQVDYRNAILSDSSIISSLQYIINNLYISMNTMTISYQSVLYTCSKFFQINDTIYYVLEPVVS